jgi:hypothetical protein
MNRNYSIKNEYKEKKKELCLNRINAIIELKQTIGHKASAIIIAE